MDFYHHFKIIVITLVQILSPATQHLQQNFNGAGVLLLKVMTLNLNSTFRNVYFSVPETMSLNAKKPVNLTWNKQEMFPWCGTGLAKKPAASTSSPLP